jgi:hypothetical protein
MTRAGSPLTGDGGPRAGLKFLNHSMGVTKNQGRADAATIVVTTAKPALSPAHFHVASDFFRSKVRDGDCHDTELRAYPLLLIRQNERWINTAVSGG